MSASVAKNAIAWGTAAGSLRRAPPQAPAIAARIPANTCWQPRPSLRIAHNLWKRLPTRNQRIGHKSTVSLPNDLILNGGASWQRARGVLKGLRNDKSAERLLRALLIHLGWGHSLQETAVRARMDQLADLSSVALWNRLCKSGGPGFGRNGSSRSGGGVSNWPLVAATMCGRSARRR